MWRAQNLSVLASPAKDRFARSIRHLIRFAPYIKAEEAASR
jgi:hypothetical protein